MFKEIRSCDICSNHLKELGKRYAPSVAVGSMYFVINDI